MISLDLLIEALGPVHPRVERRRADYFEAFQYDSRLVRPGELFVAVPTDRADGHDYIGDAVARGAAGVLAARPVEAALAPGTLIVVDDTRQALIAWAEFVLRRYRPRIVAVTGSVGKTSTQAAIARVLGADPAGDPAVFTNENQNDLFGLPIALGRLREDHARAVIEIGTGAPGEVGALAAIVRPKVAVVTRVAEMRLETFGTVEAIAREFRDLPDGLPPDGWAVVNADDPAAVGLTAGTAARVLTFGRDPRAGVRAADERIDEEGVAFTLVIAGERWPVDIPLPGAHQVEIALAAAAVGWIEGVRPAEIAARLGRLEPLPGRLRPLPGRRGARVLDDTFNASPAAIRAALAYLGSRPSPRVAILGDVAGLGRERGEWHARFGEWAVEIGRVDALIARGDDAAIAVRRARELGLPADRALVTDSFADAARAAEPYLRPAATILVKGSEEARMERVVERLIEGVDPVAVLPRQDAGWRQRVFLSHERPTWVEIDLGAIGHNVGRLKQIAGPGVEVMAVLKADAYGHGAVRVARTAVLHGADQIATATLGEAIAIRRAGIAVPILILGYTPPWQATEIVDHGLRATIFSLDVAEHLSRAAALRGAPPVPVHVKVDTGMARLGLPPREVPRFLDELDRFPGVRVEGIFTHFATADDPDPSGALEQLDRFRRLLADLGAAGRAFRYVHAANSAATLRLPASHFNLVRPGIALYGLDPSPGVPCPPDFRPALTFKTRVAQIHCLEPGDPVSYGATWRAPRPSRVATLPVGYGDGFRRAPRTWESVLIRGEWAPIVGRVAMDMTMVDVTEIPGVKAGDEVILIGRQGRRELTVDEVARRLGTINYEVVTQILARVPRETP